MRGVRNALRGEAKQGGSENSSTSTSFTLMSQILGSSLLSIAYIFSRVGFTLMFFILPLSLIVSLVLILAFIEACYLTRSFSYRTLAQKVIGPKFAYTLDAMLILLYFGYLTGYIIIASQSVISILNSFVPSFESYKWAPYVVKALIAFVIILPASLLKSTKLLSAIASVSIFFALAMALTIPIYYFISLARKGQVCPRYPSPPFENDIVQGFTRPSVPWWPSSSKGLGLNSKIMGVLFFFGYIPMMQGNYTSQLAVPPMLEMLKGPLYLRMRVLKLSITISLCFCTVLYCFAGIFGALNFGKQTTPNILSSFDVCNDYWIAVIKALYGLVVCIAYPLVLYPLKLSILSYIKIDKDIEPKRWYGIFAGLTIAFIVPSLGIALAYENIAAIFGLLGSICGAVLFFGVPIWVYYKLPVLRMESQNNISQEFREAADENGVVETEAVGTSLIALMLPGNVQEALNRARSVSNAVPVDLNTVELQVNRSRGVSVMRTGSLIGFLRGRTLSSAANNIDIPQQISSEFVSTVPPNAPPTTVTPTQDTTAPLVPGRDRTASFIVNVASANTSSRQGSIAIKNRRGSSLSNSRFQGSVSQSPDGHNQTDNSTRLARTMSGTANNGESKEDNAMNQSNRHKKGERVDNEYTESTEEESGGAQGITDVLPAVAEANQVEIGNICGVINKDAEMAKMTRGRRAMAWTCIVFSLIICIESFCVNILDFIGKLD